MSVKQGNLEFITVKSEKHIRSRSKTLFLFNGEYYKSEYVAIEYFKSKGYDAFFSENTTWKNMLQVLFKDIFEKFEELASRKRYKRYFYDDEFFRIYEDEINERFSYLKTINLESEVKRHSMKEWIKYRILKICQYVDKSQILDVLYDMIQDYAHNHVGFPDVFVFNENEYFFCEVKTKTDSFKAVQVRKIEFLLNTGFNVKIFGINKELSWDIEEKAKFFNDDYYDDENVRETYDYKIRKANRTYEKFGDEIKDLKNDFIEKYGIDTFIGFLNVISDKNRIVLNDYIIDKSKREGLKIRNLRNLSKGYYFEERGLYDKAIDIYNKVDSYEVYERLNNCYLKIRDGENQVNLIYYVINEAENVPSSVRRNFIKRANNLFKNQRSITIYETDKTCPVCGSRVMLTTLHKRNDISIFTCTKNKCHWYGGIYEGDLNKYEKIWI